MGYTSPIEFEGGGARPGGGLGGGGAPYNPPRITPPSAPPARAFVPPANQSTGGGYGGSKLGQNPGSQSTKNFPPLNAPPSPPKPPSGPSNSIPPPAKPPTPPKTPPPPAGQLPPPKAPPPPPGGNNPSPPGSYEPPGSEIIKPPGAPPFEGGQMPGVLYFVYATYTNTNVYDGRVVGPNAAGPFEGYGPVSYVNCPNPNAVDSVKVLRIKDTVNNATRESDYGLIGAGWRTAINSVLLIRQNGQPDTGGNPPGGEPPIFSSPPIKPAQFAGELGEPPPSLSPPPFEAFEDGSDSPNQDPYTGPFEGLKPMAFSPFGAPIGDPFSPNASSPLGGEAPSQQNQPNNNSDLGPFTQSTSYTDSGTSTSSTTSTDPKTSTDTKTDTKTESTFENFLKSLSPTALLIPPLMSPANPLSPSTSPQNFTFPNNNPAPQQNKAPDPVQQTAPPSSCETSNACVVGPMKNLQAGQNSLLDKVNAGLNLTDMATNLAMLNVINNKLGDQLPKGISGYFKTAWEATKMDKIINLLTLIASVHNAAMLSRNLGQTLGDAASQVLSIFNIKDHEKNPIDVNEVIGKSIDNAFKSLLGEEVWSGLKETWNKANRIVQSTSNIIWSIRSIGDSTKEILEWTAENTGKIGNALKRFGVVGDNAYKWMPEQVNSTNAYQRKIERARQGIETLDDAASSFSGALGEVQSVQEEFGQLREQKKQFDDNLKALTPKEREDNKPVKDKVDESKTTSDSPEIKDTDTEADEDATTN